MNCFLNYTAKSDQKFLKKKGKKQKKNEYLADLQGVKFENFVQFWNPGINTDLKPLTLNNILKV